MGGEDDNASMRDSLKSGRDRPARNDDPNNSGFKCYDKDPPPTWNGENPESTWRPYQKALKLWFTRTDIPKHKQGYLLYKAITGPPHNLFSNYDENDFKDPTCVDRMYGKLCEANKHISRTFAQDDLEAAIYGLSRSGRESALDFANRCEAAFEKAELAGNSPMPEDMKGRIFLRRSKLPKSEEEHLMFKTESSCEFSTLHNALRVMAYKPLSSSNMSYMNVVEEHENGAIEDGEYYDDDDDESYYSESGSETVSGSESGSPPSRCVRA